MGRGNFIFKARRMKGVEGWREEGEGGGGDEVSLSTQICHVFRRALIESDR